ncbi:hypothetical protein D9M71_484810 [compost metagenome]
MLARRDRCDVDADELTDVPGQRRRRAAAGFFGDGEQRMAVDHQLFTTVDNGLERRQQCGHPGLVVEVTGADVAAFGELRQRVEGDEIADADAQRLAVGTGGAVGVQTQFDVIPTDRHLIHGGIECVPGSHQRQDAAADHAIVGKQADPAALGKAAGPAADGREGQTAVVLYCTHRRADGVQMGGNGAVGAVLLALERGADGAATGQLEGNAQFFKAFGDVAHDGVGEPGGAGNGEHFQQHFLQIAEVRFGDFAGHGNS